MKSFQPSGVAIAPFKSSAKLPFPPYGKQISDFTKSGNVIKNDIFLFFGNNRLAWQHAKISQNSGHHILVLPYDKPLMFYRWGFVKGISVLAFDKNLSGSDYNFLRKLAWLLLSAGAAIVRIASPSLMGNFAIYRQEVEYGLK